MRLTPLSAATTGKRTGKTAKGPNVASHNRFASLLNPTTTQPASPSTVTPQMAADVLLACQSDQHLSQRQKDTIAYGTGLLDALDELQLAMLDPDRDTNCLHTLNKMTEHPKTSSGDARLDELTAWVELRAAVELAKREPNDKTT